MDRGRFRRRTPAELADRKLATSFLHRAEASLRREDEYKAWADVIREFLQLDLPRVVPLEQFLALLGRIADRALTLLEDAKADASVCQVAWEVLTAFPHEVKCAMCLLPLLIER